jgi:hypothetical protein
VSKSKFWFLGSIRASLIGSPHLMQGISTVAGNRVHVGVGRGDRSIVSL